MKIPNTCTRGEAGEWEKIHRSWQLIAFEGTRRRIESAGKTPGVVCLFVEEKLLRKEQDADLIELSATLIVEHAEEFFSGRVVDP